MKDTPLDFEVSKSLAGERVDKVIALVTGLSRKAASDLVGEGKVRVDDVTETVRSRLLQEGQRLRVEQPVVREDPLPEADSAVTFEVRYEDDAIVIVDKPAGLVVHEGAGHESKTLVSGLLARYPDLGALSGSGLGDPRRPGIVHRLDKGTSGLLVVARTAHARRSLQRQFREHSAGRIYSALVDGIVEPDAGVVEAPIGRSSRRPDRMAVTARGKEAVTEYEVKRRYRDPVAVTLLEATLMTGRTHQVRVHLAAIGHAVVGDDRYGRAVHGRSARELGLDAGRLFLHARRLELEHPCGGRMHWESPLPQDLCSVLDRLVPP